MHNNFQSMAAAVAVTLAALSPCSAQAATTVFSENFNGVIPTGAAGAGQSVGRFVVGEGEVDVLGDLNGGYYGCPDGAGNNCIDMNGNRAGSLTTTVDLTANDTYRVIFDLAGNGSRPSGTYSLGASLGGTTRTFEVPELSAFRTFSFDYTASSTGPASLTFRSLNTDSPSFWGPIIDNVRVDRMTIPAPAVPEPATWAMLLLGFGGIGRSLRRRRISPRIRFA